MSELLKKGERVILTEDGLRQGLDGKSSRRIGIVSTDQKAGGLVSVRRIGDSPKCGPGRYHPSFWRREVEQ